MSSNLGTCFFLVLVKPRRLKLLCPYIFLQQQHLTDVRVTSKPYMITLGLLYISLSRTNKRILMEYQRFWWLSWRRRRCNCRCEIRVSCGQQACWSAGNSRVRDRATTEVWTNEVIADFCTLDPTQDKPHEGEARADKEGHCGTLETNDIR